MKKIPLFYWSSVKFENKPKENYGDLLSKYIVEKISAEKVKWVHPKKQPWYRLDKTNYLGIGSILAHASRYCTFSRVYQYTSRIRKRQ